MLNDRFIWELFELWILKEFLIPETTDKLGLGTCFVGFLISEKNEKQPVYLNLWGFNGAY